ncbi:zinc-binding dehydrogenase [Actinoplanes sp. TFC3]|uniref:zinc-binding dehydrogenase n=1 Tax=Actinoplanes sp. TFC3 TaxID=1710355 RepID=UPI0008357B55|nr:zinc-binding dehydrogenase [Actinoplanes sp. TFC3]
MRAAYASATKPDEPLAALTVGEQPEPSPAEGWVTVDVRASSLNHHELWSLRGVGLPAERLPMILGCDASGVDSEGNEVVIHAVIEDQQDPRGFSLLSERWPGTLAERVAVPAANLLPKPAGISFLDAACLPTAWLTAYRMLTTQGRVSEADAVLVQGAGGGVATAAVVLAVAMGKRVYATSRDPQKRDRIAALGATAVEPGARLPERVGVVIESVGAPTFEHSLKCAAPNARIVVCGATGGPFPKVDLRRVFMMQLHILGSTMGTAAELAALLDFCVEHEVRPVIDSTYGFSAVADAFARLNSGEVFGKVAVDHLH